MAKQSQLRLILDHDVKTWNKWREENPEIRPDLSGANLSETYLSYADLSWADVSKADLRKADLHGANLSGANLSEADFSYADLSWADVSKADLSWADLNQAVLIQANLSEANLSGADLSYTNLTASDISGANITGANLHKWYIEKIECTQVIWKDKKINYTNPDDFEKSFTEIEHVVEILLDIPFSDIGYYAGRIIEQAINRKYGEGSLRLKGQTAISDDTTKFEFLSFSESDEMTEIKDKLSELQNQLKLVIEEAKSKSEHQSPFGLKSEIDIPFSGGTLVARPKDLDRVLKKRYAQMNPLLQNIIYTIQLHIR